MDCIYFKGKNCTHALFQSKSVETLTKSSCTPCLLAQILKEIEKH